MQSAYLEKGACLLQLLHGRLVCLLAAQHIGSMAVAVLCVRVDRDRLLAGAAAEGIILLGYVLGEVGRDHLLDLCRGALIHEGGVVLGVASFAVSQALGETFVVVAKHQSGVRIVCSRDLVRMLRNGRAP